MNEPGQEIMIPVSSALPSLCGLPRSLPPSPVLPAVPQDSHMPAPSIFSPLETYGGPGTACQEQGFPLMGPELTAPACSWLEKGYQLGYLFQ